MYQRITFYKERIKKESTILAGGKIILSTKFNKTLKKVESFDICMIRSSLQVNLCFKILV